MKGIGRSHYSNLGSAKQRQEGVRILVRKVVRSSTSAACSSNQVSLRRRANYSMLSKCADHAARLPPMCNTEGSCRAKHKRALEPSSIVWMCFGSKCFVEHQSLHVSSPIYFSLDLNQEP